MAQLWSIIGLVGAAIVVAARLRDVRSAPVEGARDPFNTASFVAAGVVTFTGIATVIWGVGVSAAHRAWLLAQGVGHGALEAQAQEAGTWMLAGGVVLLAAERARRRSPGRWASLALALTGAGVVASAVWLLNAPPRFGVGATTQTAALFAAGNATLLAAGLAFVLLSLLVHSDDAALRHAGWLALGLTIAATAYCALMGGGPGFGIHLPLSNAAGVPVEIRFVGLDESWHAVQAMSVGNAEMLGMGLVTIVVVSIAAGLVGSFHERFGRGLFALSAIASILVLAQLLGQIGPAVAPNVDGMMAIIAGAGISPDTVTGVPTLSSSDALQVHPASVLPIAVVIWVMAVAAAYRALAPITSDDPRFAYRPTAHAAASRDAVTLGSLLLWLGLAIGLFGGFEVTGRYVPSHQVGGFLAIGAMAAASVMAWHAALARPSKTAFGAWALLPALTLVVAALVMVSGAFTGEASTILSMLP